MEGPTSKKTKEPPKKVNHKGNIKFLTLPIERNISNKEKEGPLKRMPTLEKPSPITNRDRMCML